MGLWTLKITVSVIYLWTSHECEAPWRELQKMRIVNLVYLLFELWPFKHWKKIISVVYSCQLYLGNTNAPLISILTELWHLLSVSAVLAAVLFLKALIILQIIPFRRIWWKPYALLQCIVRKRAYGVVNDWTIFHYSDIFVLIYFAFYQHFNSTKSVLLY